MRRGALRAAAAGMILLGILLALYPWISNFQKEHQAESVIAVYRQQVEDTDADQNRQIRTNARQYNSNLALSQVMLTDPFLESQNRTADETADYSRQLSVDDTGIMGFLEIPKIDCYLPIYHGTSETVLAKGVGHIEGSSLPVGGEGSHAVLSGHTGLDSAKLFTDLTELEEGDLFFLHVLDEILAYRVIRIRVIEPEDTSSLRIEEGADLVSLLTCTPYGVNTHRLVVTGQRTEYTPAVEEEAAEEESSPGDSLWMRSYRKAVSIGLAIISVMAAVVMGFRFRKNGVQAAEGGSSS